MSHNPWAANVKFENGQLNVAGISATELAAEYGTPAFILDEPFEFLDSHQVDRLAKKVARVLTGKTVIIVSHLDLPIEAKNLVLSS